VNGFCTESSDIDSILEILPLDGDQGEAHTDENESEGEKLSLTREQAIQQLLKQDEQKRLRAKLLRYRSHRKEDMVALLREIASLIKINIRYECEDEERDARRTDKVTVKHAQSLDVKLEVISKARVPILKIIKAIHVSDEQGVKILMEELEMSIAVNNFFPLLNSRLLYCYGELLRDGPVCISIPVPDTAVPDTAGSEVDSPIGSLQHRQRHVMHSNSNALVYLIITIKQWAKVRGIADSRSGGLSSYSWTMMVIAYLIEARWLPCLGGTWQTDSDARQFCQSQSSKDSQEQEQQYQCQSWPFLDWISEGIPQERVLGSSRLQAWQELFSQRSDQHDGSGGLHRLLSGFFEYYGYSFDFYRDAIDVRRQDSNSIGESVEGSHRGRIAKKDIVFEEEIDGVGGTSHLQTSDRHLKIPWLWIIDPFEMNRVIVPRVTHIEDIIKELRRGFAICSSSSSNALQKSDQGKDGRDVWLKTLLSSSNGKVSIEMMNPLTPWIGKNSIDSLKQHLMKSLYEK
jgi:hypothetical protein